MIEFQVMNKSIQLPNPDFGDQTVPVSELDIKESMDGEVYTYVRRVPTRKRMVMTFFLLRMKSLELVEFVRNYAGQKWKFINFEGTVYTGWCKSNPLVLNIDKRSVGSSDTLDSKESVTVDLEFECVS